MIADCLLYLYLFWTNNIKNTVKVSKIQFLRKNYEFSFFTFLVILIKISCTVCFDAKVFI